LLRKINLSLIKLVLGIVAGVATRDSLRAGRSGNRNSVWEKYPAPIQIGPGAYPFSCTMGMDSFRELSGRGVALTSHTHLAATLKKVELHLYSPIWAFITCSRVIFTFKIGQMSSKKIPLHMPALTSRCKINSSLSKCVRS
jgi:hypothetical protein